MKSMFLLASMLACPAIAHAGFAPLDTPPPGTGASTGAGRGAATAPARPHLFEVRFVLRPAPLSHVPLPAVELVDPNPAIRPLGFRGRAKALGHSGRLGRPNVEMCYGPCGMGRP